MDERLSLPRRRRRLAVRIAAVVATTVLAVPLLLAAAPLGWLRGSAERVLSDAIGLPVSIGAVERLDRISLEPRIVVRHLRIAQPGWVGRGDMARLRTMTVRLPLVAALLGRAHPRDVTLEGLRMTLVRDANGRQNWDGDGRKSGHGPRLTGVTLHDVRFTLRDDRRHLVMAGTVAADARGFHAAAKGTHRGHHPATLRLDGAPIAGDGPWPFHAAFASPLARLALAGTTDHPLGVKHFTARATAAGPDLALIDDLIDAGLPGTQPVRVAGAIRREDRHWRLRDMHGTVGSSDVAGEIDVDRRGDRTVVAGRLVSKRLDFADLSSSASLAKAAAKSRRIGPRLIPDAPIDLARLTRTDGRLEVAARSLVVRPHSPLRDFSAVLTLDRSRLVVAPLTIGLRVGRMIGRMIVVQRAHGPVLTTDLRVVGARTELFVDSDAVRGPVHGRIRLTGPGRTIRDALARSDGVVTVASPGGTVRRAVAEALGRNAGAAVSAQLGDKASRVPLRCFAARYRVRRGVATPDIFTIDTSVSRAAGRGTVHIDGERIDLILDGRSKHPGLAQLPSPIRFRGTITAPAITSGNAGIGSAKTILKTVGSVFRRLVAGKHDPAAPDVDCAALLRQVG